MTASTLIPEKIATYTHRLATADDAAELAPLWQAFAQERVAADPSMKLKPDFNFQHYILRQLELPLSFGWVLEHHPQENPSDEQTSIVGCIFVYFYDEAPPPGLPPEMLVEHELDNPFQPRRVGSVLGMYVQPEHRQSENIKRLADAALQQAADMQVSDIDILVSAEQTGIQALLQRAGFSKAAVQYTKHFEIANNPELPSLHPPHPELDLPETPTGDSVIPLYDPKTNELVRNPQGDPVFLGSVMDKEGLPLQSSDGLPIYPNPVRDPQTQEFVFDANGSLVVCPVLQDENDRVFEFQGIPQFHPPAYEMVDGKLHLKQDSNGDYVFCEVEKDKEGKILRSPDGVPVFKRSLFGS
jgi:ribosomal protein S18 acetylase RimI-like enzyme